MSSPQCEEGGKEGSKEKGGEGRDGEERGEKAVGKGEFRSRVGSNKHKFPSLLHSCILETQGKGKHTGVYGKNKGRKGSLWPE